MAMDRSSASEITATGADMDRSRDKNPVGPTSPGVPNKKKKFTPLKSLKRFFAVNKKKKVKEDVRGVGMKSTSCDVLEAPTEEGSSHLAGKGTMSMSADSVFSVGRPRDDINFTRSMEAIPGSKFKNELAHKLQGRSSDDDEGLPSSPPAHTSTVDALIESGLKEKSASMDSEKSWMSVDSSETELEDFFGKDWKTSGSHHTESLDPENVDLDVVTSTTSLSVMAAKHKIAVKPKNKARSSGFLQKHRITSPMKTTSVVVLPKLKEESQPNDNAVGREDEDDISDDEPDSTGDKNDPNTNNLNEPASDGKEDELDTKETTVDISEKAALPQDDNKMKELQKGDHEREEHKEDTPEKCSTPVVLRDKGLAMNSDSAKRLTIAGDSIEVTPFGERRIKRSSFITEEKVEPTCDGSEFASVFARFRQQASQKKRALDEKADALEGKKGSEKFASSSLKKPVGKITSTPDTATVSVASQNRFKSEKQRPLVLDSNITSPPNKQKRTETVTDENKELQKTESKLHVNATRPQIIIIEKMNDGEKEKLSSVTKQTKNDTVKDKISRSTDVKRLSDEHQAKVTAGPNASDVSKDSVTTTAAELLSKKTSNAKKSSSPESSVDSGSKSSISKTPHASSKYVAFHQKSVSLTANGSVNEKLKQNEPKGVESSESGIKEKTTTRENSASDEKSSVGAVTEKCTSLASSSTHKRESPRLVNRVRSQTVPATTVTKGLQPAGDSAQTKQAKLRDASVNKENIPSSGEETSPRRASIVRSAGSGRPVPRKLSTGSEPSWIEMARKKTGEWNDGNKDKESETRKTAAEIELAEKRASVLDLMKRFQ